MKKITIIFLLSTPILLFSQQTKANKKKSSKSLSPLELAAIEFRQENPDFYKAHPFGLAGTNGSMKTSIDYSKYRGKDCSEIARKEKWSVWQAPDNADEKCKKYLQNKKVKKVLLYPLK